MTRLVNKEVVALENMDVPVTDDSETTPRADTEIIVPASGDTNATAPASMEPSIHTDERFPKGSSDHSVFIGYVDYVTLRLWWGEVYINYVELVFIYY